MAKNLSGEGVIGVCTAYFPAQNRISVTLGRNISCSLWFPVKPEAFQSFDWCDGSLIASLARTSLNSHRSLAEELNGVDWHDSDNSAGASSASHEVVECTYVECHHKLTILSRACSLVLSLAETATKLKTCSLRSSRLELGNECYLVTNLSSSTSACKYCNKVITFLLKIHNHDLDPLVKREVCLRSYRDGV